MMNDFEFYEENDLFFHRLGECKLASDGRSCSTSLAKKSGIIFVGCDTGVPQGVFSLSVLFSRETNTCETWESFCEVSLPCGLKIPSLSCRIILLGYSHVGTMATKS